MLYKNLKMKNIYWTSTILVSLFLLWSSYSYLFSKNTIEGIRELGFPDFFRVQLAILKIIAVAILLTPMISIQIKEWAYAGIFLFFITAIIAHFAHKDPLFINLINLVLITVLIVSYYYFHKTVNN